MNKENHHRHVGYQQGFNDGKRTGGRINKKYIKNLFETETQHLSHKESKDYKIGWQDGFSNAVNGLFKNMVLKENCFKESYS